MRDLVDLTVELASMTLAKKKASVATTVVMKAIIDMDRAEDLGIPWRSQDDVDGRIHPKGAELKFSPPDLGTTIKLWDDDTRQELLETGFSITSMTAKADGDYALELVIKGNIAPAKRGTWSSLMDKAAIGMDLLWATAPVRLDELDHLIELLKRGDGGWDAPLMGAILDHVGRDLFADDFFQRAPDTLPEGVTIYTETPEDGDDHLVIVTVAGRNEDQPARATATEWRAVLNEIRARVEGFTPIPEGTPRNDEARDAALEESSDGGEEHTEESSDPATDAAAILGDALDDAASGDTEGTALDTAAQAAEDAAAALGEEETDEVIDLAARRGTRRTR